MSISFQISPILRNTVTGVECHLLDEQSFRFRLCELSEKKKKVELKRCVEFGGEEAELKKALKAETAIHLVLSGKGIISKKVSAAEGDDEAVLLNKCLPGSNAEDFYVQRTVADEETVYVSIVRKTLLKAVLAPLLRHKILVVRISLGPFVAEDILPLLKLEAFIEQQLVLGQYELTVTAGKINNIRVVQEPLGQVHELEGLRIEENYIYAFAAAMGFYLGTASSIQHSDFSANESEYAEFKRHNQLITWILIGIALICLINFGIYKYYRSQFKDSYAEVQINQEQLKNFDNMKQQFEEKKAVLDRNGLLEASRISYYSDKIAASLLGDIKLTKLESFPLKKTTVDGVEDISFQGEKIMVSGTCSESIEFNTWERVLKKMDWVSGVSIIHYMQEKEGEQAQFTIEIELKKKRSV